MIGFMFAHMEPFTVIIGGTPGPFLVCGQQPFIVPFAKFGQCSFSCLLQQARIEVEVVTFYLPAGGVAQGHGYAKFILETFVPFAPFGTIESVLVIKGVGGRQVKEHGANGIGFVVQEEVQLFCRHPFGRIQHDRTHPGHHGYECAYLRRVALFGADDVEVVSERGGAGRQRSGREGAAGGRCGEDQVGQQ